MSVVHILRNTQQLRLLYEVTKMNVQLQYENNYLGILWYLLGPFLLFVVLLIVFAGRFSAEIEHYPLYLLLGIILWNFFSASTGRSITVLQQNAALLKSISLKKELFVLSTVLTALVSHFFEIVVYICIALWYGVAPTGILLFLFVLFFHVIFTLGFSLFLSGIYIHVRDIGQIWSIINRVWWFATPIMYAEITTGIGKWLNVFNPLYYIISLARDALIYHHPWSITSVFILMSFSLVSFLIGTLVFFRATHHSLHLL